MGWAPPPGAAVLLGGPRPRAAATRLWQRPAAGWAAKTARERQRQRQRQGCGDERQGLHGSGARGRRGGGRRQRRPRRAGGGRGGGAGAPRSPHPGDMHPGAPTRTGGGRRRGPAVARLGGSAPQPRHRRGPEGVGGGRAEGGGGRLAAPPLRPPGSIYTWLRGCGGGCRRTPTGSAPATAGPRRHHWQRTRQPRGAPRPPRLPPRRPPTWRPPVRGSPQVGDSRRRPAVPATSEKTSRRVSCCCGDYPTPLSGTILILSMKLVKRSSRRTSAEKHYKSVTALNRIDHSYIRIRPSAHAL